MKPIRFTLLVAGLAALFWMQTGRGCDASKNVEFRYFFRDDPEELLGRMSIDEKIGQILIFGFRGSSLGPQYEELLADGRLGNIKIFLRNVRSRHQMLELTDRIASLTLLSRHGIPPFIATDMEGGTVNHVRYSGIYLAPAAGLIGATENVEYGRAAARLIALTLYNHGVNMNLAPCVDVLTDWRNRVIGTRSYGSDPRIVAGMARVFIEEHRRLGILTTAKHFPGHGMTLYDSHLLSASVDISPSELRELHLSPYQSLIDARVLDGVMVSHLIYSTLDPFYPASLSSRIIEEYLRGEMGFDGIVLTDDLEMQGTQVLAEDILKAFILAFRAGNDLFLVSHSPETQMRLVEGIGSLFESGILDEEQLDRKVLRILHAKQRYLNRFYGTHGGSRVQEKLLQQSIEENVRLTADGIVLISSRIDGPVPSFFKGLLRDNTRGLILSPSRSFAVRASRYLPGWELVDIGFYPEKEENWELIKASTDKLGEYDFILLGFANERHIPWARACVRAGTPYAILSYDNPQYALRFSSSAQLIVTCFAPYNPATDALFLSVFRTGRFLDHFPYDF
jgi:beta-N-acetylhexosaminidase